MGRHARARKEQQKFKQRLANLYWKKDKQWFLWFQHHDDETFKEIPGAMGFYFISNYGQTVSFRQSEPREMKQKLQKGLFTVTLSLEGQKTVHKVEELVFRCFYRPLRPKETIEHIDGDPGNNHYKNLRPRRPGALKRKHGTTVAPPTAPGPGPPPPPQPSPPPRERPSEVSQRKEVLQFDLEGYFVKRYPSILAAAKAMNSTSSHLSACLHGGKGSTAYGYQWYFLSDPIFKKGIRDVPPARTNKLETLQFSLEGKFLRSFGTLTAAAKGGQTTAGKIEYHIDTGTTDVEGFQYRFRKDPYFRFGIRDIPAVKPKKRRDPRSIAVVQFDLRGRFIAEYPSLGVAESKTGTSHTDIGACVKGKMKAANDFLWRRRDEPRFKNGITDIEPLSEKRYLGKGEILQYDLNGKLVNRYPDAGAAGRAVGATARVILLCVRGKTRVVKRYHWLSSLEPRFKDGIGDIPPINIPPKYGSRAVVKFSRTGRKVAEYRSIKTAAEAEGLAQITIVKYVRGLVPITSEFYWQFKENHPEEYAPPWIKPRPPHKRNPIYKEVVQFDKEGRYIKTHTTMAAAGRAVGVSGENIWAGVKKKVKAVKGFQWYLRSDPMFAKGIVNVPPVSYGKRKSTGQKILQFSLEGRYLATYPSMQAAMKKLRISNTVMSKHLKGGRIDAGGFQFYYACDPLFREGICNAPAVDPNEKKTRAPGIKRYKPVGTTESIGVVQFNLEGGPVAEHTSISAAARAVKGSKEVIGKCLDGKKTSAYGYMWMRRDHPGFTGGITAIGPHKPDQSLRRYVLQFDLEGHFIRQFASSGAAVESCGAGRKNINSCLSGFVKTSGGFQWRYSTDPLFENGITDIPPVPPRPVRIGRPMRKFDADGRLLAEFPTMRAAAKDIGVNVGTFENILKGVVKGPPGITWEFKEKKKKD